MSDFLPEGYTTPVSSGGFMKLQDGDNQFRVLSSAITGYEYWTNDKKPVRSKVKFENTPDIKPDSKVKHFWAFVVWNYATKAVEILELTQSTIMQAIENLTHDEDFGSPKGYDIKVTRSGQGIETEYSTIAKPPKETPAEILAAYAEKKINLEALYDNGNPFETK